MRQSMRPLTPAEMLDLCDQGHGHGPTVRALLLLAAVLPEVSWEDLLTIPLGARDRRLLHLRALTLGPRLEAQARCPACQEAAEIDLDTAELLATDGTVSELELSRGGLRLRVRPATSGDLLAAAERGGVDEARWEIAGRCLLGAFRGEEPVAASDLTAAELSTVAAALLEADPGAELLLELRCPACAAGWRELLDVAAFFWAELEIRARRVLLEVHLLARAYNWREADILELSPRRRRQYLELLGA